MPYRTIWEEDGIKWEFYGQVTSDEIREANETFFNDPRSESSRYQIVHTLDTQGVEWRPVEMVEITFNDVAASKSGMQLKLAYIANNPKIREKIEKYVTMSRNLNTDWEFKGFTDEEAAREWIADYRS